MFLGGDLSGTPNTSPTTMLLLSGYRYEYIRDALESAEKFWLFYYCAATIMAHD
jgi:hypothetical protein